MLGGVTGAVGVVVELITTTLVTLLVVFFYLKDGPEMWAWFLGHQRRHRDEVDRVGRAMWSKVGDFVRGAAIVAAADAVGIALGAWILGVPSVFAILVLTFMLSFIPYFGAVFAGGVTVALAIADGGVVQGAWMLLVVVGVQQLEGNVLEPLLVGRFVRLHPLVVALGVIAGGTLAGVVGMFLAVPLIAAITAGVSELRQVVPDG
ncbi:MAG: AI-2E family transporter [Ilumatobacteraceae bacterium]